jgi:hypothetical protein
LSFCTARDCSQAVNTCAIACLDFGSVQFVNQCVNNDPSCA